MRPAVKIRPLRRNGRVANWSNRPRFWMRTAPSGKRKRLIETEDRIVLSADRPPLTLREQSHRAILHQYQPVLFAERSQSFDRLRPTGIVNDKQHLGTRALTAPAQPV